MSENIRQTSEGESAGFSAGGLFENGKVKQHASEMEKRSRLFGMRQKWRSEAKQQQTSGLY